MLAGSPHAFLAGPGAEAFAVAQGMALCEPTSLVADAARERLRAFREGEAPSSHGAVALDEGGHLASAAGRGEPILRALLCRDACERRARGATVDDAAWQALESLRTLGGEAGLLLLAPDGRFAVSKNTERMVCAWVDAQGTEGSDF